MGLVTREPLKDAPEESIRRSHETISRVNGVTFISVLFSYLFLLAHVFIAPGDRPTYHAGGRTTPITAGIFEM
jgi:hypothetical protein